MAPNKVRWTIKVSYEHIHLLSTYIDVSGALQKAFTAGRYNTRAHFLLSQRHGRARTYPLITAKFMPDT